MPDATTCQLAVRWQTKFTLPDKTEMKVENLSGFLYYKVQMHFGALVVFQVAAYTTGRGYYFQ
ncbi:hypothetical protein GCM10007941_22240 [Amphritea balenae]|nr:hypothetical protein GCM10007941_22240 [Amphritea balenae]